MSDLGVTPIAILPKYATPATHSAVGKERAGTGTYGRAASLPCSRTAPCRLRAGATLAAVALRAVRTRSCHRESSGRGSESF